MQNVTRGWKKIELGKMRKHDHWERTVALKGFKKTNRWWPACHLNVLHWQLNIVLFLKSGNRDSEDSKIFVKMGDEALLGCENVTEADMLGWYRKIRKIYSDKNRK